MDDLLLFGLTSWTFRVWQEAERSGKFRVVGIVDDSQDRSMVVNVPVLSETEALAQFDRVHTMAFAVGTERLLNQDRLVAYMRAKKVGFRIASVVSATAAVASDVRLRENVFIDAGVRVLRGANIGANSWILCGSEIGVHAKLGSSCWVASSCEIGDGASLGKNCTLARGVAVDRGVILSAWSLINRAMRISESSQVTLFVDPLFRERVVLRGKPLGVSPEEHDGAGMSTLNSRNRET